MHFGKQLNFLSVFRITFNIIVCAVLSSHTNKKYRYGECSAFLVSGSDPTNGCVHAQIVVTSPPVNGSNLLQACVPLLRCSCFLSPTPYVTGVSPSPVSEARRCLQRIRPLHGHRCRASTVYEARRCLSLFLHLAKRLSLLSVVGGFELEPILCTW